MKNLSTVRNSQSKYLWKVKAGAIVQGRAFALYMTDNI